MIKKHLFDAPIQYMLLDTTNGTARFVLKAPVRHVQLHARIQACQNPGSTYIAPPVEARSFSKLSENQLLHLIYSLGSAPEGDYANQCQQALALVQGKDPDTLSEEALSREVTRLGAPEPTLDHERPVKAAEEKPKKEKKHDTSFSNPERPKAGTTTALVWDLCDAVYAKLGRAPTSKEAFAECEKEGIKAGTFSVQFGKWKKVVLKTG